MYSCLFPELLLLFFSDDSYEDYKAIIQSLLLYTTKNLNN